MAMNTAANRTAGFALRALQLIFAVIVIGIDGFAIHLFRGNAVLDRFAFGSFYDYYGVPDARGFLLFCAGWAFLGVIFLLVAGGRFADRAWIGYVRVAVDAVAVLSWLAGFIAVAVNIWSNACPAGETGCGPLKAATVFGGLEWLLFVITTTLTVKLAFDNTRWPRTSTPTAVEIAYNAGSRIEGQVGDDDGPLEAIKIKQIP